MGYLIDNITKNLVDEYNKGNIQPCFKWYEVMPFMIMIIVFGIVILKIFLIKEPENDFVHIKEDTIEKKVYRFFFIAFFTVVITGLSIYLIFIR